MDLVNLGSIEKLALLRNSDGSLGVVNIANKSEIHFLIEAEQIATAAYLVANGRPVLTLAEFAAVEPVEAYQIGEPIDVSDH